MITDLSLCISADSLQFGRFVQFSFLRDVGTVPGCEPGLYRCTGTSLGHTGGTLGVSTEGEDSRTEEMVLRAEQEETVGISEAGRLLCSSSLVSLTLSSITAHTERKVEMPDRREREKKEVRC